MSRGLDVRDSCCASRAGAGHGTRCLAQLGRLVTSTLIVSLACFAVTNDEAIRTEQDSEPVTHRSFQVA